MLSDNLKSQAAFRTKKIQFLDKNVTIILQDINGPCSLVAVANSIILSYEHSLKTSSRTISADELIVWISEYLCQKKKDCRKSSQDFIILAECLQSIPSMLTGLDVNIYFSSPVSIDPGRHSALFNELNIPLCHGWIFKGIQLPSACQLSYDDLMVKQTVFRDLESAVNKLPPNVTISDACREAHKLNDESKSTPSPPIVFNSIFKHYGSQKIEETLVEGHVLKDFMNKSGSQLTKEGIELLQQLPNLVPHVFYWNYHFLTIVIYKNVIYSLVTDDGYHNAPDIVWQRISSPDGSGGNFYNGRFERVNFKNKLRKSFSKTKKGSIIRMNSKECRDDCKAANPTSVSQTNDQVTSQKPPRFSQKTQSKSDLKVEPKSVSKTEAIVFTNISLEHKRSNSLKAESKISQKPSSKTSQKSSPKAEPVSALKTLPMLPPNSIPKLEPNLSQKLAPKTFNKESKLELQTALKILPKSESKFADKSDRCAIPQLKLNGIENSLSKINSVRPATEKVLSACGNDELKKQSPLPSPSTDEANNILQTLDNLDTSIDMFLNDSFLSYSRSITTLNFESDDQCM